MLMWGRVTSVDVKACEFGTFFSPVMLPDTRFCIVEVFVFVWFWYERQVTERRVLPLIQLAATVSLLFLLTLINNLSGRESCDFLQTSGSSLSCVGSLSLCLLLMFLGIEGGYGHCILCDSNTISFFGFFLMWCGDITVTLMKGHAHLYVNVSSMDFSNTI